MTENDENESRSDSREQPAAHRVTLPGFIRDEEVGLGDVIKRATSYFGIKPCEGCDKRREALNRWVSFSGRR